MRKIRIFEHISLDGVIEHDDGYPYGAWTTPYRSPAGLQAVIEAQGAGFDLLLGRRTYDIWSGFWQKTGSSPMADSLNAATKYVATHRPESLRWGPVKDLGADIIESVRGIKSKAGPDLIVWGSSTLTSVLLGQGKGLFSDSVDARELAFVSTKATPTGVLINTYRYVGSLRTK